ncbi:MAG: NAD(+)/NADH kinase [Phycisphaerae bacterium]|nr:NAD(+)/NADH kinase [Phycisphaerae bacterium]
MPTSVLLIVNRSRAGVREHIDLARELIARYATVRATIDVEEMPTTEPVPAAPEFDLAVVLGGDGTLLAQVRRLLERQKPILGVNFGRLGFLAEFDWDSFVVHAPSVLGGRPLIRERMVLSATVFDAHGRPRFGSSAINDCVIAAGPPYRMIELAIRTQDEAANGNTVDEGPDLVGDGVIVSTPIGSTAYNVSAGGPIVHPAVDAIIVTPNAAHSLAFRPVVVPATIDLSIRVLKANEGTAVVLDGQLTHALHEGDVVRVVRHPVRARLVGNPSISYWRTLLDKMRWAAPPTYRDRGP